MGAWHLEARGLNASPAGQHALELDQARGCRSALAAAATGLRGAVGVEQALVPHQDIENIVAALRGRVARARAAVSQAVVQHSG